MGDNPIIVGRIGLIWSVLMRFGVFWCLLLLIGVLWSVLNIYEHL